jgi:hypothetical protein
MQILTPSISTQAAIWKLKQDYFDGSFANAGLSNLDQV